MTKKLMLDDLKRSGITESQARSLGFKPLTGKQTAALVEQPRADVPSYVIPYHDISGAKTDYWRVRYLDAPKGAFGARMEDRRYSQPKETPPHLYFAPCVKWKRLAKDVTEPVVITEGEKKAASGCLAGIPTIGLGGVWSWKSTKFSMDMLPEFDEFAWDQRKVYLCFDSDMNDKPQVAGALHSLANKLLARGSHVMLTRLEESEKGDKVGLDDFLVRFKPKDKGPAIVALLETSEEFSQSAALYALNDELAVVQGTKLYHIGQGALFQSKAPLREIAYAGRKVTVLTANGTPQEKLALDLWLEWPLRREHRSLTYMPGEPLVTADGDINTWQGWGAEPVPGEVQPFLDLAGYICEDDPGFYHWFMQWLAYPIQHPGTKLKQSVVLWSPIQGVGKTFIGVIMGDLYGDNYINLTQEQLHSPFNDWAARRQFVLGDEITGSDRRRDADRLKQIITQETVAINAKYQAMYTLPDCINYLFTSNHPAAFFLEDADRRFAVHQINAEPKPQRFYQAVDRWRKRGGIDHLFDYLLQYDLTGFDPDAPALLTESKEAMIQLGRTELEDWLATVLAFPKEALQMDGHVSRKELWTSAELVGIFDPEGRKGVSPVTVGRHLTKRRLKQRTVRVKGQVKKLWPVVNPETWEKRESTEWAAHLEKFMHERKF